MASKRVRNFGIGLASLLYAGAVAAAEAQPTSRWSADLDEFEKSVIGVDPSFAPRDRRKAIKELQRLREPAGELDASRLAVELCRVVALGDNGHTNCVLESLNEPTVSVVVFPLRDALHVLGADEADADLLGARLTAIDGRPIAAVRARVRQLAGGLVQFRDLITSGVYARPGLLHALGVARASDAAEYTFLTADGRAIARRFAVVAAQASVKRALGPPTAWAFQDPTAPYRWADAPAHDAVIVQLRRNVNVGEQTLPDFIAMVERHRADLGRRNIVLDLRSNGGGDSLLTRESMDAWPRLTTGRFAVLMGARTFSAGMITAAYLKQSGGDRVRFIGQSPGDRLMFFAENHYVKLPALGLNISVSTARDDLAGGCRRYTDCFAGFAQPGSATGSPPEVARAVPRYPIEVRRLAPDVAASMSADDWLHGRDPVMRAALSVAGTCASVEACEAERQTLAGSAGR